MDQSNFMPLSGFRDLSSPTKEALLATLKSTFLAYGYQPLETPSIERQDILLSKYGVEGEKLMYLFVDNGGRKVGLRYDLTVPLSRYIAANLNQLVMPYKRYEIGNVWRADKPQKGRYRQFTQADIDIVDAPEPSGEIELFSVVSAISDNLDLKLVCELNDRRVVTAILDKLKISSEERPKILSLLDKKDKLPGDKFEQQFIALNLTDNERKKLSGYFLIEGNEALTQVEGLIGDDETLKTLKLLLEWAKKRGVQAVYKPAMVRGLDYYTGTIFEFKSTDKEIGTLIAGGRYDSLIKNLIDKVVPAIGLSFGVDRICEVLNSNAENENIFIVRLSETSSELNQWVRTLRQLGMNVEVYLDENVELGKQIKYADKRGYKNILIPFEDEWNRGEVVMKNLLSGEQKSIRREEVKNNGK